MSSEEPIAPTGAVALGSWLFMNRASRRMLPVAIARGARARAADLIFERRRDDPLVGLGLAPNRV
jgi:hypothetical protein